MAFCAAIATAVTVGACGSGMPGNAVVQVGAATITQPELDHWLAVANDSQQLTTGTKPPPLPLPPNYTACVAGQLKTLPASARNTPGETASLKAVCAQQYQQLSGQILNFLIQTIWIQADAADRGVKVSPKEIDQKYQQALQASTIPLKTTAQLNNFLAETGQTVADLKWRTMLNVLGNAIELKIAHQAQSSSRAQIAAYYNKNRSQFTTVATRNLHLVLTTTQAQAQTARSLLASGSSYATVAAKYSADPTTKAKGGVMTGVLAGELTPVLNKAVFAANVGVLSGPIKTPFGYYVFTVDSAVPGSVESLAKATPSIKSVLASQAVTDWQNSGLQKKWQPRTNCRSGFSATYCSNAPKTSTTGA